MIYVIEFYYCILLFKNLLILKLNDPEFLANYSDIRFVLFEYYALDSAIKHCSI